MADPGTILPKEWVLTNYTDVLFGEYAPTFWRQALQQRHRGGGRRVPDRGGLRVGGGVRVRPTCDSAAAKPSTCCSCSVCCSRRPSRSCRCTSCPPAWPVGQFPRGRPAPGRVRPAAHDRHPPAVLPEHPDRARGRRADRRLQHVRLLLADPAAAGTAGARDGHASWPSSRRGTPSSCHSSSSTAPSSGRCRSG